MAYGWRSLGIRIRPVGMDLTRPSESTLTVEGPRDMVYGPAFPHAHLHRRSRLILHSVYCRRCAVHAVMTLLDRKILWAVVNNVAGVMLGMASSCKQLFGAQDAAVSVYRASGMRLLSPPFTPSKQETQTNKQTNGTQRRVPNAQQR